MKRILLYSFLIWVIPFFVSFIVFPLKENERPLFESIMPVILALSIVISSYYYFKKVDKNYLKIGLNFGIYAFAINIILDLLMFMWGPMKMTPIDYVKDIGATYLLIPVVIYGIVKILSTKV